MIKDHPKVVKKENWERRKTRRKKEKS